MPARSAADDEQRAVGPQQPSAAVPALSSQTANRRRAQAAVIAVAWCAALTWLALTASNPVTLNRQQILEADAVITARIEDLKSGKCRVVRQWTGATVPEELIVRGLDETSARGDGEWILPLQASRNGHDVLPSALPAHARLVYPATDEAVRQLTVLVEGRRERRSGDLDLR